MDKAQILNYIENYRTTFLGENFKWRKSQKESIFYIVKTYIDGVKKFIICDMPTGSGKSIIAMCSSYVINKLNSNVFILASDIALQEQYENDFKKFNLNWGSVKGVDNYVCVDNMEKHSLGTCKIRNISSKRMSCYNDCPYFCTRNKASHSKTSLLNYSYWLIMMNYVNKNMDSDELIFPPRDVIIADEAHKILNIVQNHYSPRFNKHTIYKFKKLTEFFNNHNIEKLDNKFNQIKKNIGKLHKENDNDKLFDLLSLIEKDVLFYFKPISILKEKVNIEYKHIKPPKEWREVLYSCDWVKDFHCKLEDYISIIKQTSKSYIVKNPQNFDDELVFNCLEESYLMEKYFHAHGKFFVLMSATISDPNEYSKNNSLKNISYLKLDNHFDFSKSPIYFYNKRRMSYKYINDNLPWLYNKVNEILINHENENGIIHSASYDLSLKLYKNLNIENRKRVLIYNGTAEKKQAIEILKKSKNKILMGPAHVEGLDLSGDLSRFQIFVKVPYASLSDEFVKRKMQINQTWYRYMAIVNILQGIGRSKRSENDYCVTYFLDGSLSDLIHYNRKAFPIEFIQRLKILSE